MTCTDEYSAPAGVEEALLRERPLRIVHAVEPMVHGVSDEAEPDAAQARQWGRHVLQQAEELAALRGGDVVVTTELLPGPVAEALLAESDAASTLVIGSRGLGGFTGLLLGSVGLRLAGHAQGPLVVVRGSPTTRHHEVVIGMDKAEKSQAAIEYAFEEARLRQAKLRVIHTWFVLPTRYESSLILEGDGIPAHERKVLHETLALWRDAYPDVPVLESVLYGHAVAALCDASARADLVVVGSHGRSKLGSALLGSVSHGVLHHAHSPVAVVGPGARRDRKAWPIGTRLP
ncbi:universal stress protein [Nonomuraea sp. NPDC050536]|uniref:universal stress protein n=1 Tax=Nonomuraea sp. NPDC050536 TaxID=3364366 RepID=UPI0037CBF272